MEWSDEFIWAYVEGELSAEERSRVEQELLRNPVLSVEIETMRDAMALLRGDPDGAVPRAENDPRLSRAGRWERHERALSKSFQSPRRPLSPMVIRSLPSGLSFITVALFAAVIQTLSSASTAMPWALS